MEFLNWCIAHKTELIISAAVVVLIIIICLIIRACRRKKKSAVGKIYKTTDGFLGGYPTNKKHRRVVAVEQRKDDEAVAVVKIYSQKNRKGKAYIANIVLTPEEHKSLTENSIIGSQVIIGVKKDNGELKPIFVRDLSETDDELTGEEIKAVKKGVHNDTPQHRKTYDNKMRRWRRHFKK